MAAERGQAYGPGGTGRMEDSREAAEEPRSFESTGTTEGAVVDSVVQVVAEAGLEVVEDGVFGAVAEVTGAALGAMGDAAGSVLGVVAEGVGGLFDIVS